MVKKRKKHYKKKRLSKSFSDNGSEARKINASTAYGTCSECFCKRTQGIDTKNGRDYKKNRVTLIRGKFT